jgi:DNA mismatch repair protein MutL
MSAPDPNIGDPVSDLGDPRPIIRQLDDAAINRIAAGEVVERPASVVKELIENALDARASRVEVFVADGGKTLIRVTDNGVGMTAQDLPLALSRHATSKIDGSDLLNIHSFGFRGEALPSLGAVGRLTIRSRVNGGEGCEISVSGGAHTIVELRDLFYATPARLKFLRTDRAEMQAISEVVKRLAMAEPFVTFVLTDVSGGKSRVTFRADGETGDMFDALHARLRGVLGKDFAENALAIDAQRDGVHLTGFAALPTYSRGSAVQQFLYVNGRPVRDKVLIGALRGAYMDTLSRDRHPAACLFIDVEPTRVDVNVHPAKSEVRFRDPAIVRGLIVSALRAALAQAGHRASSTVAHETLGAMHPEQTEPRVYQMDRPTGGIGPAYRPSGFADMAPEMSGRVEMIEPNDGPRAEERPLGAARAQVHENYIIAQTETGIVIVDGHAAHERLVYEKLKTQMGENGVAAQALLIPEIIEMSDGDAAQLLAVADDLSRFGLTIEPFGGGAIAVRETPAILGEVNAEAMLRDILDELSDLGTSTLVQEKLEAILSRIACHGSIRTGRSMRGEEMNALLREMERTPRSGQCNHGRPTYVELKLSDIERLFGRT